MFAVFQSLCWEPCLLEVWVVGLVTAINSGDGRSCGTTPFNSGIGCCLQVGSVRIKLLDSQLGAGQLGVQLLSEKTPQNSPHNKPIKYMTIFFFLNNARGNAPSYSQTRSLPQPLHTCHMAFFHKPLLQKTADGPPCRLAGWQHRGRACTFPAQQIVSSCATYRHPNSCN